MSQIVESGRMGRKISHISETELADGRASGAIVFVSGKLFSRLNLNQLVISNSDGKVGSKFSSVVTRCLSGSNLSISPETPLPKGLTFDNETRTFGGVPEVAGSFSISIVEVNDSANLSPRITTVGPFVIASEPPAPAPAPEAKKVPAAPVKKATS